MLYFIATTTKATVHSSNTRYEVMQFVKVEVSRDEAFDLYQNLQNIQLFKNPTDLKRYSEELIRQTPAIPEPSSVPFSNDKELTDYYGHWVLMRPRNIVITYCVEVGDDVELTKSATTDGFKIKDEDKQKLTLQFASIEGYCSYLSDEVAAKENKGSTVVYPEHIHHKHPEQNEDKYSGCTLS